jgi:hypothetical protein
MHDGHVSDGVADLGRQFPDHALIGAAGPAVHGVIFVERDVSYEERGHAEGPSFTRTSRGPPVTGTQGLSPEPQIAIQ